MEFRLSNPPSPNDLPAADAELLALLLSRGYCQDLLSEAEEQENYPACVTWLKAVNSGLPVIVNVLLEQWGAVATQKRADGEREPVLSDDVNTVEELLDVLRAVALAYRRDPHSGIDGISVDHPTRANDFYWFALTEDHLDGVPAMYYEGCISC